MDWIGRAAEWAGLSLDPAKRRQLHHFADWLRDEAIPAGGLGPNEAERLKQRHLGDSLLFAGAWRRPQPPIDLLDLGSGVGLPGIPLAILWPETAVTLLDRAGRRVQLARRAIRVLGLDQVEVIQAEAGTGERQAEMVVARAAAEPRRVLEWVRRATRPGGIGVVGGSHREAPVSSENEEILAVPAEILDHPVWLRIMAAP
jgi:16S rRNA (guanine(527)-N(7))-methyltransferase RsmG